jgi:hypothetical protein
MYINVSTILAKITNLNEITESLIAYYFQKLESSKGEGRAQKIEEIWFLKLVQITVRLGTDGECVGCIAKWVLL